MTAIIKLLEGAKRAEFSWCDEPGEYQWLLTHREQVLSIRITRFRNWEQDRRPNDRPKRAFKMRCALREFATAVLAQLTELYNHAWTPRLQGALGRPRLPAHRVQTTSIAA